jgi:apolipoprotein N-acyltransferase
VRCCNTGVTALVQPTGLVEQWIQPHTQGGSIKPVTFVSAPITFYTRHGDWFIWMCFAPPAIAVVLRVRRPK